MSVWRPGPAGLYSDVKLYSRAVQYSRAAQSGGGSSSLPGPALESGLPRQPGGSGDAHCVQAPSRGPSPLRSSARSSMALWQLIAIAGPSRTYLNPRN